MPSRTKAPTCPPTGRGAPTCLWRTRGLPSRAWRRGSTTAVVALARPRKAGLTQRMRGQRGEALRQHALRPDDLTDGRGQIVVGNALGHTAKIVEGTHMRIQERQLITAVIEPHKVIAGVHEVHEAFPGMPLRSTLFDHHVKKVDFRAFPRPIAEWHKDFRRLQ